MSDRKKLGIIGGMGPAATAFIFNNIIKMTHAQNDHDHIELFIHNNCKIPDRTKAILNGGPSPLPELRRSAHILEKMGADLLIIPCMTSHFFLEDLQKSIHIPVLNAIKETVIYMIINYKDIKKIGIMATSGTVKSQLFQKTIDQYHLNAVVLPDDLQQNLVMSAIYGKESIKSGIINDYVRNKLIEAAECLVGEGAEAIIAGCTEIPLALTQDDIAVPFIDPMKILARRAISQCLGEVTFCED